MPAARTRHRKPQRTVSAVGQPFAPDRYPEPQRTVSAAPRRAARTRHRKPQRTVSAAAQPTAPTRYPELERTVSAAAQLAVPDWYPEPQRTVSAAPRRAARTRHRKPSALQGKPAKATAVTALAVSAAAASGALTHWSVGTSGPRPVAEASAASVPSPDAAAVGLPPRAEGPAGQSAAALTAQPPISIFQLQYRLSSHHQVPPKGRHHRPVSAITAPASRPSPASSSPPPASSGPPPASGGPYSNPLRAVAGLIPERVDMGVDFGGSGPVYPLGDAVITNATGSSSGWPGGGWITYRLTDGPDAGLMVYVAEDVTPTVAVGDVVTPSTVIATMYNGGTGIETGWAMPDGASAESELAEAGGVGGGGPFPTMVGLSFENLLRSLGVPASSDVGGSGYGALPPGYPAA